MKQAIIIGSGFSGATSARLLAEKGYKVSLYDRRPQIGGNMYDFQNEDDIVVQQYGPHIFHTNIEEAMNFLNRFTTWFPYEHRVKGMIDGKIVPIPFNLTSLEQLFPSDKAQYIKSVLVKEIGMDKKVPIMELKKHQDPVIREFGNYVYDKVFHHYTLKQWGMSPEQLGPSVMNRVPVYVSYEDRYFLDRYQVMPQGGFTPLFKKLLDHPNIQVTLNYDAIPHLHFDFDAKQVLWDSKPFDGVIIYTGCLDELLNYRFGPLPYRTLRFDFERLPVRSFQEVAVVNYPNEEDFTRISEFSKFTQTEQRDHTVIIKEYPSSYQEGDIPYYPIEIEPNISLYQKYQSSLSSFPNFHSLGRLASYRYINMDAAVLFAIKLIETIER